MTAAARARHVLLTGPWAITRPRGAALLATVVAILVATAAPPGGDDAAHLYLTQRWSENGFQLWDNLWYSGRYSQINYSLLFYPLAAAVGMATVAIGATAGAVAGFGTLVRRLWPDQAAAPTVAAALFAPLGVLAGTYPFMLGLALALWALVALTHGRRLLTLALVVLTTLAHPLALVFLVVALAATAAANPGWWSRRGDVALAAGVGGVVLAQAILVRGFASDGRYPFEIETLAAVAGFCAAGFILSRGLASGRLLRMTFGAYGALALVTLAAPGPLGGNVARLLLLLGVPLLLIPLSARGFRPRAIAVTLVAAAVAWQALPAVAGWRTASDARAADESFWLPAVAFLDEHHDPNHRVHVVATADNWEAYHLARRGVPLTRGWFRQDDFPVNRALYGDLTTGRYVQWLRQVGVRYVLLPDDPLDPSAQGEAAVVRAGRAVKLVARMGSWSIYELPRATAIATPRPDIEVLEVDADSIRLRAARPGTYRLRARYTPYWRVTRGAACVAPRGEWGSELHVRRAGVVRIEFSVRLTTFLGTVVGSRGGCDDAAAAGPRANGSPAAR